MGILCSKLSLKYTNKKTTWYIDLKAILQIIKLFNPSFLSKNYSKNLKVSKSIKNKNKKLHILNVTYSVMYFSFHSIVNHSVRNPL